MPAPAPPDIRDGILDRLPFPAITSEQFAWCDALGAAMSGAWQDWQDGITGGGLTVSGSGLGTWTGTGTGGALAQGSPIEWVTTPTFGATQELGELDDALRVYTADRFQTWVQTYTFASAPYEGTSTATTNNPGTFDATAVATPLATVGIGQTYQAIKADVISDLSALGWRPDQTDDDGTRIPQIREWLDAYDQMVADVFASWLQQTDWVDNTVQGPAAAGTGSGSATSNQDGALS